MCPVDLFNHERERQIYIYREKERTLEIKNWICFAWEQAEGEINGATKHGRGKGQLLYVAVRGRFQMLSFVLLLKSRNFHYTILNL